MLDAIEKAGTSGGVTQEAIKIVDCGLFKPESDNLDDADDILSKKDNKDRFKKYLDEESDEKDGQKEEENYEEQLQKDADEYFE